MSIPAGLDLDALLALALVAGEAGATVVREAFGRPRDVRAKAPGDWVSATDTAAERAVRAVLADGAPFPVFGEEEGGERAEVGWLVDPLDGTTNFLHGYPVVGVSIALVADHTPLVAVVHAPILGDVHAARAGGGTTRNGLPVTVGERPVASAVCATGFPFRAKARLLDGYFPVFRRALTTFEDLRRAGAASLDLSWTAAGVYDGYFEQALGPWDVAAGALLVREAGGVVTDWAGDPDAWLDSGDIVAAPAPVHAAILDCIAHPA